MPPELQHTELVFDNPDQSIRQEMLQALPIGKHMRKLCKYTVPTFMPNTIPQWGDALAPPSARNTPTYCEPLCIKSAAERIAHAPDVAGPDLLRVLLLALRD